MSTRTLLLTNGSPWLAQVARAQLGAGAPGAGDRGAGERSIVVWDASSWPSWMRAVPIPALRRRARIAARSSLSLAMLEAAVALAVRSLGPSGRAARSIAADLWLRGRLDRWAAARLTDELGVGVVVAPTLAARATFAAAHRLGLCTVLALDLPLLEDLHADLDRAAAAEPESAFLRNFRAGAQYVARQEAELRLADVIVVRGPAALARLANRGLAATTITPALGPGQRLGHDARGPLLLAGAGAARAGMIRAIAIARREGCALVARCGAAAEAHLEDPSVRWVSSTEGLHVRGVVSTSVCEAYPWECLAAEAAGIPVITR
jgi:hypothetical protein